MSSFKVHGINHIGLAPKDPAKAKWFFSEVLSLPHLGDESVGSQKTKTTMYSSRNDDSQRSERLEIVEPIDSEGPIQQFLEKRGGGIHHIALSVSQIEEVIVHLKSHGVQMVDDVPRDGAHNTKIAFVHPKSTGGLLVELVEE